MQSQSSICSARTAALPNTTDSWGLTPFYCYIAYNIILWGEREEEEAFTFMHNFYVFPLLTMAKPPRETQLIPYTKRLN